MNGRGLGNTRSVWMYWAMYWAIHPSIPGSFWTIQFIDSGPINEVTFFVAEPTTETLIARICGNFHWFRVSATGERI
jgi:hypothetical protein